MAARGRDPYQTLDVSSGASDDELHAVYRRLVQLHHPDHNAGSTESTRRFEAVQEAYAEIRRLRDASARAGPPPPGVTVDPDADSRLAELERRVREEAVQRARQAARRTTAERDRRPSDEELGYVTTEDSLAKILADARSEWSDRFADARKSPDALRVADLINDLASKLTGEPRPRPRE